MRIVSIGDLVTDYYYMNEKLLGLSGGMTCHNVVANLAALGFKTAALGVCGNDNPGQIAIKSLSQLGVDTKKIIKVDAKTRSFHVFFINDNDKVELVSKKRCPICGEKDFYDESKIDFEYIVPNIRKDDVLVIDNINDISTKIMHNVKNDIVLDLGQFYDIENLSADDLLSRISGNVTILQLNNRMLKFFYEKFKTDTEQNLFNILKPKLMIVTKGKNGADFLYNGKTISKKIDVYFKEKDPSGAGDAFLSSVIYSWIENGKKINAEMINEAFDLSKAIIEKVVNSIGARSHLQPLYDIKKISGVCTCKSFVIKNNVKRYKININNLKKRTINACGDHVFNEFKKKFKDINGPSLFVGTGGSYAAACFSSRVYNEIKNNIALSIYPRDVLYQKNNMFENIFCFSYSGTTSDIIAMIKKSAIKNKYLITKGRKENIAKKTDVFGENIISYVTKNNQGKDRGFLSFDGTLSPASLFFREFAETIGIDYVDFINESFERWNLFYSNTLSKNSSKIKEAYKKRININIFKGDNTNAGAHDLESKLIESGTFNVLLHEKKNFSHGRFINFENLNPNLSIFFGQKNLTEYEELLIDYLDKKSYLSILLISKYDGILADFDLLIATQLFIGYIGDTIGVDVSKPKYSEDAMKIYHFKGDL